MGYWLEVGYHYWEGDERPGSTAIKVPPRPSADYVWDGSQWQDNSLLYWHYDGSLRHWVLRPQAERDAIDAEAQERAVLAENMVLVKFAGIMLLELNAIRAGKPRPQEVTDFIDRVKVYL